jgi:hypothetical protein
MSPVGNDADGLRFELWDSEECAKQLRMSAGGLRNLGSDGPKKILLGGKAFYRPEHVDQWLDSRAAVTKKRMKRFKK